MKVKTRLFTFILGIILMSLAILVWEFTYLESQTTIAFILTLILGISGAYSLVYSFHGRHR